MRIPFALSSRGYRVDPEYKGPGVRLISPDSEARHFYPLILPENFDTQSADPVELIAKAAFEAGWKTMLR